jgi:hypothetical protein
MTRTAMTPRNQIANGAPAHFVSRNLMNMSIRCPAWSLKGRRCR